MPPLESMDLVDEVLVWRFLRTDEYNQTVRDTNPTEMNARVVYRSRVFFSSTGTPVGVDGTMALAEAVPLHSLVWEGRKKAWDPSVAQKVLEVTRVVGEASDLKGRHQRYEYGFNYYRGSLPEGVG